MRRIVLILTLVWACPGNAPAAVVYDSGGFESFANGQLVGQTGGNPLQTWADFVPNEGLKYMVQSGKTNGGNRAVSVTSTSSVPSYVAPPVNYTPAANEVVVIEVDIARTIATQQFLPSSYSYALEAYDFTGVAAVRFGLRVNLTGDGIEAFVSRAGTPGVGTEDRINVNVAQNQWVSFRAELNYATDRFRLLVDGNEVAADLGFITAAANLADADLNHNTTIGSTDTGYFDNYRVSTMSVPEPGSFGWCTLIGGGWLYRRRQRG